MSWHIPTGVWHMVGEPDGTMLRRAPACVREIERRARGGRPVHVEDCIRVKVLDPNWRPPRVNNTEAK